MPRAAREKCPNNILKIRLTNKKGTATAVP